MRHSELYANRELAATRWLREYLGDVPKLDIEDDDTGLTIEDPDERGYDPRNHRGRLTRR